MRRWTRLAIGLALTLSLLLALAWGIGSRLPRHHTATLSRELPVLASTLWAAVVDLERWPEWRSGVESVDRLPDRDGKPAYREIGSNGTLVYVVEEVEPPVRMVVRVVDNPDFGGTWTYEIESVDRGTRLEITEEGEISSPLFRFCARFLFGYEATMEGFVRDVTAALSLGDAG